MDRYLRRADPILKCFTTLGGKLVETLQRFRADYPTMPIILISGGGTLPMKTDHLAVARELGVRTLRKPVSADTLLDALRSI